MIERPKNIKIQLSKGSYQVWFYENGKRTTKNLGTADSKKAQKLAEDFLKDAPLRKRKMRCGYIYYQLPWELRMPGGFKKRFKTKKEALEEKLVQEALELEKKDS